MNSHHINRLFTLAMILMLAICTAPKNASAQSNEELSFQTFYDELKPFGDWIYEERYGYVWIPAETDFHPYYTNGYWEMTIYGNTWISLYPWGWAPFHYGRWTYDPFYGWIWIPGYQWAPAWVCWRHGDGFYGWAPLRPDFFIYVGFGNYRCPDNWWIFTPHQYLYGAGKSTHYFHNRDHHRIRNSSLIRRTATDRSSSSLYPTGPSPEDVKNTTGQPVTIRESRDVQYADQARPTTTDVGLYRPAPVRPNTQQPYRPAQAQHAPRPIHENQPVILERGSTPEYKKTERPAPGQIIPQDNKRSNPPTQNPVRIAPQKQPTERPAKQPRQNIPRTDQPAKQSRPQQTTRPVQR